MCKQWRNMPPSREEIAKCPYWWNNSRTPMGYNIIVFSIDDDNDTLLVCEMEHGYPGTKNFNPLEWGDKWAPCIPPQ